VEIGIDKRQAGRFAIANASVIALTVFLGAISAIGAAEVGAVETLVTSVIISTVLVITMLRVFRSLRNLPKLAFVVPAVLFGLNFIALLMNARYETFFLIACVFICGLSSLYASFSRTFTYIMMQAAAIVALYLYGVPILEEGLMPVEIWGVFFLFMFCCAVWVVISWNTTNYFGKILAATNSFSNYLATTHDFVALLDADNRVLYMSKPMSDLAGSEGRVARGRPFIDLFPGRDLKTLADRMLGHRDLHEEDWEFSLNGKKQHFRALSSTIFEHGQKKETLVTLLDMPHVDERDEIVAMKDSLQIGLFFMDRNYVIQENYSLFLEEAFSLSNIAGRSFIEILSGSLSAAELSAVKDYFDMVFDDAFHANTLREINPLHELRYVVSQNVKKIFNCEFTAVDQGEGGIVILATIYDITSDVELQEKFNREEKKRQDEMSNLFELLQTDPYIIDSFLEDMEHNFALINRIWSESTLSNAELLLETYQLAHSIKSNAVTVGLSNFGSKVHELESRIKKLRALETTLQLHDILGLATEAKKLTDEKDAIKELYERIKIFRMDDGEALKSSEEIFMESLRMTAQKVATDSGKKTRFVSAGIDMQVISSGPRRLIKEVLVQLVRNAVVHGLETPEERRAAGKNETGTVQLSMKLVDKSIHIRVADDGKGIDFNKIRDKALSMNLISEEDADNKGKLINAIFLPGLSTADSDDSIHAGRGVGLYLVHDRIRASGGSIKLQTELGRGTAFNIVFSVNSVDTMEDY